MTRPIVGIVGNHHLLNDTYRIHGAGLMISDSVANVTGAIPLVIPADPDLVSVEELMETCDGFLFPGGRPNVHPEEYGHEPTPAHGDFDRGRDRIALPLIRALTERGQPYLAICRGYQEVAVAFGSTLHPEIRDLPGRDNHRMPPDGTIEEKFALRHDVTFTDGGPFHRLMGARTVRTNTLHGQGVTEAGPRFIIDGHAPDGTPEASYIKDAPGFTLSVQWHPEYQSGVDPVSRKLFEAFGDAVRDWSDGRRSAPVRAIA